MWQMFCAGALLGFLLGALIAACVMSERAWRRHEDVSEWPLPEEALVFMPTPRFEDQAGGEDR